MKQTFNDPALAIWALSLTSVVIGKRGSVVVSQPFALDSRMRRE